MRLIQNNSNLLSSKKLNCVILFSGNDHRREHQQRQQLKPSPSIQQSDHASRLSLPNQQRSKAKISSENNDRVRKELKEINNINNNKSDVSPKAPDKLVVSISLVLLKRIPGQNNRVKNELDSDNFTRTPVKNEPLSPQNWSSLSHSQSDGYSNKRHSSPPPGWSTKRLNPFINFLDVFSLTPVRR